MSQASRRWARSYAGTLTTGRSSERKIGRLLALSLSYFHPQTANYHHRPGPMDSNWHSALESSRVVNNWCHPIHTRIREFIDLRKRPRGWHQWLVSTAICRQQCLILCLPLASLIPYARSSGLTAPSSIRWLPARRFGGSFELGDRVQSIATVVWPAGFRGAHAPPRSAMARQRPLDHWVLTPIVGCFLAAHWTPRRIAATSC